MGSIYTIEVPSGHQLKIEANSPDEALGAANAWQPPAAAPMSAGDKAVDAYKGLGTGAIKGTLALGGMVGDLTDLASKGIEKASNAASDALGIERYQRPETPSALNAIPTTESLTQKLTGALGDFYQPKSDYGKATEKVGEFIPGAAAATATGGGTLAGNLTRYAVAPGLATFAADKGLPESDLKPYLTAAAGLASSIPNPSRLVTPFPATAAKQAAVEALRNEGVTSLTAGQQTGNKTLQYLEHAASEGTFGGNRAEAIAREGQHQFTEAAMRRAGAGPDAAPEIIADNQRRLGQGYRDISARNTVQPDNQMVTDIVDAVQRYHFVPGSQQHAMVQGYIDDIIPHINNGSMSGQHYQALRSFLTADAASASDGHLRNALTGIRNALDNTMTRSVSPEDAAAWRQLNREYSAQEVIKKAASRAGEATAEGQITPANLRNTIAGEDRSGYAQGRGQFNELARAGVQAMTPLPNSGTAQRMGALQTLDNALIAIPRGLAGRAVMSAPVQSILANQLMSGALPASPEARRLLIAELLQRTNQPYRGPNLGPLQPSDQTQ